VGTPASHPYGRATDGHRLTSGGFYAGNPVSDGASVIRSRLLDGSAANVDEVVDDSFAQHAKSALAAH
jgi:hypothetical protein